MNTDSTLLSLSKFQKEILIEELGKRICMLLEARNFTMCSCIAVTASLEVVFAKDDNDDCYTQYDLAKIEMFEDLYRKVTGARFEDVGFIDIEECVWYGMLLEEKNMIRAESIKKFADYIEENF